MVIRTWGKCSKYLRRKKRCIAIPIIPIDEAAARMAKRKFPYGVSNVGPEHIVRAMGNVHDVHHPENQGKSARQKEEDSRIGNTGEGLNNKEIHSHNESPFHTNVE
jgi:hypothetical protein